MNSNNGRLVIPLDQVLRLRRVTGAGLMACRSAILYAQDHESCSPEGYLKAKALTVSTPNMSFEHRVRMFSNEVNEI